jgi:hypothetical protein
MNLVIYSPCPSINVDFLFKIKTCEKNNCRHITDISRIYPPPADWEKGHL